jgi:hypothetical protein
MGQIRRSWEFFRRMQMMRIEPSVMSGTGQVVTTAQPSLFHDEVWVVNMYDRKVQVFDINGNFKKKFFSVTYAIDVFIYNDEVYITRHNDLNDISVYDLNGNLQRGWGTGFLLANEITVYNNRVYVAVSDGNQIRVYNLNGTFITFYNVIGVGSIHAYKDRLYYGRTQPYTYAAYLGIMNLDGTPVASYNVGSGILYSIWVYNDEIFLSSSRNGSSVDVYDFNGNLKRSFGSVGSGNGQFGSEQKYLCVYKDEIYVSDTRNHRVQVFDLQGNFKRKFGTYGSNDGQFNYPAGIFVW